MFEEPVAQRILGYLLMINFNKYGRNLPDITSVIKTSRFTGLRETLVIRKENLMIDIINKPVVKKHVISHNLNDSESKIYTILKRVLKHVKTEIRRHKMVRNTYQARKFQSYILSMLTYTRTFLVCPMVTLSSIYLDVLDFENKSDLSKMLYDEFNKQNLYEWLNNADSVLSSRMKEIITVLGKHINDRVVLFSSFRTNINVLKNYVKDRPSFEITSTMSHTRRGNVLEEFSKSKNGVLLLTYSLGSDGLNLQCANTVLIVDFWWNSGKTNQSVARVDRFGQLSEEINIYYFTSNTGIEKALFEKHLDKKKIGEELIIGHQMSEVSTMSMNDILRIIDKDDYSITFNNTYTV